MSSPGNLGDLIDDVADVTARCEPVIWGFGVGGTLSGLIRTGRLRRRPELVQRVVDLVSPSLTAAPGPTDHLIAVEALRALAEVRPDLYVTAAYARWLDAVRRSARPVPDQPPVHRSDLAAWRNTIWVDCMHTDGPGLAVLGYPDEAVRYATEYAAALQLHNGLFQHGYDVETRRGNGVTWGRGQAWALLGLVDTLRHIPDDGLASRLTRLVEALAGHEDDGRWHTVVDDPAAPIESSVSAYLAFGIPGAIELGLVDADFQGMADRAFGATLRHLYGGGLPVSEATPVGTAAEYHDRALGIFPWGQAPVLHALLDRWKGKGES